MDVSPTGEGLPPGQGTVKQGARIYAEKCAACHGPDRDRRVQRTNWWAAGIRWRAPSRIRTVGSYWPYATTLYDYIHRAMPFNAPQSLTTGRDLFGHRLAPVPERIIAEDAVIDAQTLRQVEMPNRNGFIPDARPDIR